MKDFIRDAKDGFEVLPDFLVFSIFLGLIASLFGGPIYGWKCFFVFVGIWAVIFIGFPCVILILDTVNRIFGLTPQDKKTNK